MNKRRRHGAKRRRNFPRTFVNAYAVDLAYGGREEGGWYYDVDPSRLSACEPRPIERSTRTPAGAVRRRARAGITAVRASAAGCGGYVQRQPAAPFPSSRPYYE
jgi:hypothetical protein